MRDDKSQNVFLKFKRLHPSLKGMAWPVSGIMGPSCDVNCTENVHRLDNPASLRGADV